MLFISLLHDDFFYVSFLAQQSQPGFAIAQRADSFILIFFFLLIHVVAHLLLSVTGHFGTHFSFFFFFCCSITLLIPPSGFDYVSLVFATDYEKAQHHHSSRELLLDISTHIHTHILTPDGREGFTF